MAKKTARSRRDERPRISEAQLQAYRARKAATATRSPAVASTAVEGSAASAGTSFWGRVEDEYAMIRADLKRLFVVSVICVVLIIALWFILG